MLGTGISKELVGVRLYLGNNTVVCLTLLGLFSFHLQSDCSPQKPTDQEHFIIQIRKVFSKAGLTVNWGKGQKKQ